MTRPSEIRLGAVFTEQAGLLGWPKDWIAMINYLRGFVLTALCAGVVAPALAGGGVYASTDKFGYSGSANVYNTLADAVANAGGGSTLNFAQRDGSAYFVRNHPDDPAAYSNIFATAWWYTTDQTHGAYSGWGNPNNQNDSFVQLYNYGISQGGFPSNPVDTSTSFAGGWTDNSYTQFSILATGENANYANSVSRMWNGTNTTGEFVNYTFSMLASGLNGQVDNRAGHAGYITSFNQPASISGFFSGIFHTADDKWLNFRLNFNDQSWAYSQGENLNGAFSPSEFSAQAVPEPFSLTLGFAGVGLYLRRRLKAKKA